MGYYANRNTLENYIADAIANLDSAMYEAGELGMDGLEAALKKRFDELSNLEDKLNNGVFDQNW